MEVIVFPRQFDKSRNLLEEGKKVLVEGDANIEENAAGKVIANTITEFSDIPSELWIAFPDKETYQKKEQELMTLLMQHKGKDKVLIALAKERQRKMLPIGYWVNVTPEFLEELKKIYGENFVKYLQ